MDRLLHGGTCDSFGFGGDEVNLICKLHPRYQAKKPPRTGCVGCTIIFNLRKDGNSSFFVRIKNNDYFVYLGKEK